MLLQRKNESRDASSRSLTRNAVAGRDVGRIAFNAEEKLRAHQQSLHGLLDPAIETSILASLDIERHDVLEIRVHHGPAISAPFQRGKNPPGASSLFGRVGAGRWMAHKNPPPAGRVRRRFTVIGTADGHHLDGQFGSPATHARAHGILVARLILLHERHADHARPGFQRHVNLQRLGVSRKASETARLGPCANFYQLGLRAIYRDFELVGLARGTREFNFEDVVAIQRNIGPHSQSAPRAKRKSLHVNILRMLAR